MEGFARFLGLAQCKSVVLAGYPPRFQKKSANRKMINHFLSPDVFHIRQFRVGLSVDDYLAAHYDGQIIEFDHFRFAGKTSQFLSPAPRTLCARISIYLQRGLPYHPSG